ncbi:MAG: hypothetical protein Barrevirus22_8 [Barrevirus sp.]|uniref:Homeobox domain-containing protein n=1 Tax=Barrevirus sp. TaxID=2487763 RepID=A0A3G4ZQS0_9VIRU|nr:MAG: hypothetical protein Barrevirus22_8 [Barrevirus sp.]
MSKSIFSKEMDAFAIDILIRISMTLVESPIETEITEPVVKKLKGKREKIKNAGPLNEWFLSHLDYPYPNRAMRDELASRSGLTEKQVANWFGNARKRRPEYRKDAFVEDDDLW